MMSYKDEGRNQTGSLNKGATHMENIKGKPCRGEPSETKKSTSQVNKKRIKQNRAHGLRNIEESKVTIDSSSNNMNCQKIRQLKNEKAAASKLWKLGTQMGLSNGCEKEVIEKKMEEKEKKDKKRRYREENRGLKKVD